MALNLDYFKKALLEEKKKLEGELGEIAVRNPDQKSDWNVTYPDMNVMSAAKEEVADQEEEFENRSGLELGLESRLRDINEALEHIRLGKYGVCEVGGEEIDEARLKANPAAVTCVKHGN
ncbi:MAG: TraR/DksA C4-type zinc finger protein [bacterium]|nr:TraR/DksA C4-type zinc finger protein [bacterium]